MNFTGHTFSCVLRYCTARVPHVAPAMPAPNIPPGVPVPKPVLAPPKGVATAPKDGDEEAPNNGAEERPVPNGEAPVLAPNAV